MCAAIANWYTSQYGTWNRTRRLQVPPYIATESNVTRSQPGIAAADALILNMNEVDNIIGPSSRLAVPSEVANKKDDTLFGPGVGIISSGPSWADSSSTTTKDEISPDVLKTWLAKSKDTSVPTTTLQALVNLKRPTIKLSPLSPAPDSTDGSAHIQHGLEFEFDCDAPKCGIKMFAVGQRGPGSKLLVFETLVEGGFGRTLRYDEGAVLELAHLEASNEEFQSSLRPTGSEAVADTSRPLDGTSNNVANISGSAIDELTNHSTGRSRKRFSHFTFKKRNGLGQQQVAGPALPVVDADSSNPTSNMMEGDGTNSLGEQPKAKEEPGIRVVIEIEALDEEGSSLFSPNSQLTYLHIVRMGSAPVEDEDRRPWMVKVVKREAKIGSHLFHLHEIYGLSSTASSSHLPATEHSYPPTEQANDDQTSECLLCLSSPREVVLLPCRHLVACRECAINMVEFGAGGNLVHTEVEAPTAPASGSSPPTAGDQSNPTGGSDSNVGAVAHATTHPTPSRRKRKAKGWFCPVCRQPYTSLLRITASPPEKEGLVNPIAEDTVEPPEASVPAITEPGTGPESRSFFPRANFLRSLSRPGSRPNSGNTANMV